MTRPGDGRRLAGARCLLVDDDALWRGVVAAALQDLGATVVEAGDGVEAIRLLGREDLDLVVLDHHMPGRDGLEVLAWMRGRAATVATPVVLLSADDDPAVVGGHLRAGADATLTKPVSLDVLVAQVGRELDRRSAWRLGSDLAAARAELAAALLAGAAATPARTPGLLVDGLVSLPDVAGAAVVRSTGAVDRVAAVAGDIDRASLVPDDRAAQLAVRQRVATGPVLDGDRVVVELRERHRVHGRLHVALAPDVGVARREMHYAHVLALVALLGDGLVDLGAPEDGAAGSDEIRELLATDTLVVRSRAVVDTGRDEAIGRHVSFRFPAAPASATWALAADCRLLPELWRAAVRRAASELDAGAGDLVLLRAPDPSVVEDGSWRDALASGVDVVLDLRDLTDGEIAGIRSPVAPVAVPAGRPVPGGAVRFLTVEPDAMEARTDAVARARLAGHRHLGAELGAEVLLDPLAPTDDAGAAAALGIAAAVVGRRAPHPDRSGPATRGPGYDPARDPG